MPDQGVKPGTRMTTLPRLAPPETSITTVLYPGPTFSTGEPDRKAFSSIGYREFASWGGSATHHCDAKPAPHTASGVGRSLPRLEPLHPPKYSRTVSLETTNPHYQNDMRSLHMKREQYHKFHRMWMKPIYGTKMEQEDYRKHIRSSLKDQMSEKDLLRKKQLLDRVGESTTAVAYDKKCLDTDKEDFIKKSTYLHKFRDENKRLMEQRWQDNRQDRDRSNRMEQELLRYNPINWSQSLR